MLQELIADLTRRLERLEAENRALAPEVAALRAENVALTARVRELEGGRAHDQARDTRASAGAQPGTEVVSRRGLLRHLGTAAAVAGGAVAGASLLDARPAGAASGAMQYGTSNLAGSDWTVLTSACSAGTFLVSNTRNGSSMGSIVSGVENSLNDGPAVFGYTMGTGNAIKARSTAAGNSATVVDVAHAGLGRGVDVTLSNAGSSAHGVLVSVAGSGRAVYAKSTGSSQAVFARMAGTSNATWAYVENTSCTKAASLATTDGSGPGVEASSAKGVGGKFTGKTAQVRLVASGSSNHPASGVKGDLFVDSSGRLWFCRGGATWKQLA